MLINSFGLEGPVSVNMSLRNLNLQRKLNALKEQFTHKWKLAENVRFGEI